jgi:hypothetical protein
VNWFDNTEEKSAPVGLSQYAAEKLAEFEAAKTVTSTARNPAVAQPTNSNGSVFNQLDEHADWYDDILGPKGWAEVKPGDSQTLRAFRRPGATYPISAKVLKVNPHVLVNHSEDSGLPVGAGQKLTKARVLAHLHYGGDESALAKALIRGDAIGPRPHIAQLFKSVQTNHSTVAEVTIDQITTAEEGWSRWADLRPHLDGTVQKPQPSIGGERDDGIHLLYPKRWHTCIGLTGCGKTSFALWHIKATLDAGGHVTYLHFEETDPGGVLERLQGIGVSQDVIDKQFHWANCDKAWAAGEMAYRITQLEQPPALAVLDGINAACSQHGWKVGDTEAIGSYRAMFVTPLVKAGAAVLSLGHPPKARDRQNEMHGFGSTGWLDEVDGVGFRMTASKNAPMMTGAKGFSSLYVVKDRYSQVKRWGNLDTTKEQPWFYMGAFIVDDAPLVGPAAMRLNVPEMPGAGGQLKSTEAVLADHIEECLQKRADKFDSVNSLKAMLAEDGVKFTRSHVPIALEMLVNQERLSWPKVTGNKPRPGRLIGGSE